MDPSLSNTSVGAERGRRGGLTTEKTPGASSVTFPLPAARGRLS